MAEVEGEIDLRKDSHAVWTGAKADPGGLGRRNTVHIKSSKSSLLKSHLTHKYYRNLPRLHPSKKFTVAFLR